MEFNQFWLPGCKFWIALQGRILKYAPPQKLKFSLEGSILQEDILSVCYGFNISNIDQINQNHRIHQNRQNHKIRNIHQIWQKCQNHQNYQIRKLNSEFCQKYAIYIHFAILKDESGERCGSSLHNEVEHESGQI